MKVFIPDNQLNHDRHHHRHHHHRHNIQPADEWRNSFLMMIEIFSLFPITCVMWTVDVSSIYIL